MWSAGLVLYMLLQGHYPFEEVDYDSCQEDSPFAMAGAEQPDEEEIFQLEKKKTERERESVLNNV